MAAASKLALFACGGFLVLFVGFWQAVVAGE